MDLNMMDRIHIRDMKSQCILGVYESERTVYRDVMINLTMLYNRPKAAVTDDLSQAVDYSEVTQSILSHVKTTQFELIESLAESIASHVLNFSGVLACRIILDKPGTPDGARSTAVEIFRKRRL